MSKPITTSDVPSPSVVRSSEAAELQQNGSPPAPAAEPEAVTRPSAPATHPEDTHQLLSNESVVADSAARKSSRTYDNGGQSLNLTSNASTPRLSPVPLAQTSQWPSLEDQSLLGPSQTLSRSNSHNVSSPDRPAASRPQSSPPRVMDGLPNDNSQFGSSSSDDGLRNNETALTAATATREDAASFARAAREEAFTVQRNRSRSRSSQKNVEKSIEATLVDQEPAHQARARKSSHLLGLFKENAGFPEMRKESLSLRSPSVIEKSDGQAYSDSAIHEEPDYMSGDRALGSREQTQGIRSRSTSLNSYHSGSQSHANSSEETIAALQIDPRRSYPEQATSTGQRSSATLKSAIDKASRPGAQPPRKRLPSRLLEEIRHHHNVDTPFHHKFKKSQTRSGQDAKAETEPKTTNDVGKETRRTKQSLQRDEHTSSEEEDDEEEGSDKEHISSALYYPHQAPSPDALQDVDIGEAREKKNKVQEVCTASGVHSIPSPP